MRKNTATGPNVSKKGATLTGVRGRPKRLTSEEEATLAERYLQGIPVVALCESCGLNKSAVYLILRVHGAKRPSKPKAPKQRRRPSKPAATEGGTDK